jgi:hypothetical protein
VYEQKLLWIEKKHVVLWDEGTKRDWLIHRTSALLYLVRMSRRLYRTYYSNELLFNEGRIQNSFEHDAPCAMSVLSNRKDRECEFWCGKSENVTETEWKITVQEGISTSRKRKISS